MRKRINWFNLLQIYGTPELMDQFFSLSRKLRKGKYMSGNRCAYNVLKSYYSTTTIDELLEKMGLYEPDMWVPSDRKDTNL